MPVETLYWPVPSTFRRSEIFVSRVLRSIVAARATPAGCGAVPISSKRSLIDFPFSALRIRFPHTPARRASTRSIPRRIADTGARRPCMAPPCRPLMRRESSLFCVSVQSASFLLSASNPSRSQRPCGDVDEQRGEEHAPHHYKRSEKARVLQTVDTKESDDPKQRDERCDHERFAAASHPIRTPSLHRRSWLGGATRQAPTSSRQAPCAEHQFPALRAPPRQP